MTNLKTKLMLLVMVFTFSAVFVNCKKEEDPKPPKKDPPKGLNDKVSGTYSYTAKFFYKELTAGYYLENKQYDFKDTLVIGPSVSDKTTIWVYKYPVKDIKKDNPLFYATDLTEDKGSDTVYSFLIPPGQSFALNGVVPTVKGVERFTVNKKVMQAYYKPSNNELKFAITYYGLYSPLSMQTDMIFEYHCKRIKE